MIQIKTAEDAEQAVDAMAGLLERLRGVLEQETELVRACRFARSAAPPRNNRRR
jgi:hypothetical protein